MKRVEKLTLSPREAAPILGWSVQMVQKRCRQGKLPHMRIGRRVFISIPAIQSWIAEQAAASLRKPEPEANEPEAA
jgi:excisionase family DNA binding protein